MVKQCMTVVGRIFTRVKIKRFRLMPRMLLLQRVELCGT